MAEDGAKTGQAQDGAGAALLAAALGQVSENPKVDALIERQIALADLQIADLEREGAMRRWSLRFSNASAVMKVAFEIAVAFIGLAVAVFLAAAIWSAAHDDGLVIEAFEVPPDMAARGLTGQAMASRLLDKLSALQAATNSARPGQSYTNNWGGDIKVEIPNTGISIGEFKRTLAAWLGHETHISGEVFRDPTGVTVTARVGGGGGGASFHGADSDLDALLQKAAESVYRRTQPYRYATYLMFGFNNAEKATWADAIPIFRSLTADPSALERSWAYVGLGNIARYNQRNLRASSDDFHRSLEADPRSAVAFLDLSQNDANFEHEELALADAQRMERLMQSAHPGIAGLTAVYYRTLNNAVIAQYQGDFAQMARSADAGKQIPAGTDDARYFWFIAAEADAFAHDVRGARGNLQDLHFAPTEVEQRADFSCVAVIVESLLENDRAVTALEPACEEQQRKTYSGNDNDVILPRDFAPLLALAKARLGDLAGGERMIAATPRDCDLCLRMRGGIAALKHDWDGGARWFALVSARTPHIPYADSDWGRMLLAKGDPAGAVAKFAGAHRKGPHFADPLEGWGEALIAQNRCDLALAKFADAEKYAPHWARLHRQWGLALTYLGRKDEASKEFALAKEDGS